MMTFLQEMFKKHLLILTIWVLGGPQGEKVSVSKYERKNNEAKRNTHTHTHTHTSLNSIGN